MPLLITLLFTFAALGLVFVFVIVAGAIDGFSTLRAWRRVSRSIRDLDKLLASSLAKHKRDDARHDEREHVAGLDKMPMAWPCERDDCPYKARCGQS